MRQHHDEALAPGPGASRVRRKAYEVIFEHETTAGRAFDVGLIAAILASVAAIMLESVPTVGADTRRILMAVEWGFTLAFTVEYALRLWCVRRPRLYALSFFGVVDLLAVLPTWLSLVVPGGQAMAVVRILRVVRVFRILKLVQYVGEARVLGQALRASRYKITVFVITVISLVVIVGSLMYLVEGAAAGFTSIPAGVYWAVVTLTTVGFGDITPITPFGQFLATIVMLLGYAIIAVPTGIVSVELSEAVRARGRGWESGTPGSDTAVETAGDAAGGGQVGAGAAAEEPGDGSETAVETASDAAGGGSDTAAAEPGDAARSGSDTAAEEPGDAARGGSAGGGTTADAAGDAARGGAGAGAAGGGGAGAPTCPACGRPGHDEDAVHCKWCGARLG